MAVERKDYITLKNFSVLFRFIPTNPLFEVYVIGHILPSAKLPYASDLQIILLNSVLYSLCPYIIT